VKYIISNTGITFFHNNRPKQIAKGTTQYAKILKSFDLPADQQDSAISDILNGDSETIKQAELAGFSFEGGVVKIDGEVLPDVLAKKIESLKKEGLQITLFLPFWRELRQNPDYAVVNDRGLYDFLSYRELPITETGEIIAYRGVQKDYWSISGNPETKVLQGKTNKSGQIFNGIGEVIEIVRNQVTTDRSIHCSRTSLHLGSLNYARNWGPRVIVVKVNPRDIVSVASDCECQKLRVCKYEVIGDLEEEILAPATDSVGKPIEEPTKKEATAFEQRIANYLDKKYHQGFASVSVKQIRNTFSPEYPDSKRVLAAVDNLGYVWVKEKCVSLWVNLR
jgi:hypothetical protein